MAWWEFALLGASGGATVEILSVYRWVGVWQSARRTSTGRRKRNPPKLRQFVDGPVHAWTFVLRALLGGGAAVLFGVTGQISGAYVAVALGFAAPSVLNQLGKSPQVAALITGTTASTAATANNAGCKSTEVEDRPKGVASDR